MGLSNPNTQKSKFVTIVAGLFTIRLPEGSDHPQAVERVLKKGPKAGQTIKELRFSHLDGLLVGGEMKTGDYGTDMVFDLVDGDDSFKLQIPLESGFFGQIAKRLPNADSSKEIQFIMGHDKEKDKPYIFMRHDGVTVPMKFVKDNPNGMPPPIKTVNKGQEGWVWTDQDNFLYDVAVLFLDGIVGEKVAEATEDYEQLTDEPVPF